MITNHRYKCTRGILSVLSLVITLANPLKAQPSVDIGVVGLSVCASQFEPCRPRQVTINFCVVNAGEKLITTPFRTSVFPGKDNLNGSQPVFDTYYLTIKELAPGQTVYVSRTVVAPLDKFDIKVEVDVDHAITESDESNNIALSHYKNPIPDAGRWVSIGPTRITLDLGAVGRLSAIAIHPTSPSTIYVGARGSGVWKTINGGSSWRPISDALPTLTVSAIAIDPSSPSRIYIATPVGVFRSQNSGTSWVQLFSGYLRPLGGDGGALLVHLTEPNKLYLTSCDGVYRSNDGGNSWSLVLSGGAATALVIDQVTPNTLYAALSHRTDPSIIGIYETTNGGPGPSDWRKLTGCPGVTLPTVPAGTTIKLALSNDRLYASYKTPSSWTLYRTTGNSCSIGGQTELTWEPGWSATGSIGNDPVYARLWGGLYADPTDANYVYAGGTDLWVSTDGGTNFTRVTEPHVDHHDFAIAPNDPKIIYTASDGGIYRSLNRGVSGDESTWSFIGEGIANVEFYDIADAATEPNLVIGGTQDNGTSRYDGSSKIWEYLPSADDWGDFGVVEIDPTNAEVFYEAAQSIDQLYKSTNGGDNWQKIGNGLPTNCPIWVVTKTCNLLPDQFPITLSNHFLVHPSMSSILLATCHSLWRGQPWTEIFTPVNEEVVAVAVDPTINLYYAGTNLGNLYVGPAGTFSTTPVVSLTKSIIDIEVDPDDPLTVYVALSGKSGERVDRLRRSSPIPTTMTVGNITSNLPVGLSVNTVAVDRKIPLTIYAGTNKGVYRGRSTDNGTTWSWTPYNNGLPAAVFISDLEIHPTTGVMRAATFGRGAFMVYTILPYDAEFVSQQVPSQIQPYKPVDVSITMRNSGSEAWLPGFKLVSLALGWTLDEVSIKESVASNDEIQINFKVTALSIGDFGFRWQMAKKFGGNFGDISPHKTIQVGTTTGPQACANIEKALAGAKTERASWQAMLKTATPSQKPGIVDQIQRVNGQIAALEAQKRRLGCPK